jgi:hypothetical protein
MTAEGTTTTESILAIKTCTRPVMPHDNLNAHSCFLSYSPFSPCLFIHEQFGGTRNLLASSITLAFRLHIPGLFSLPSQSPGVLIYYIVITISIALLLLLSQKRLSTISIVLPAGWCFANRMKRCCCWCLLRWGYFV